MGNHLVSCSEDQTARLRSPETGEPIAVLRGHTGPVLSMAFSPTSAVLATGVRDHLVRLWDVAHVLRHGVLRGHTSFVYDVAFSPDGTQVASAAWDDDARIWDATTGQLTALLAHRIPNQILTGVAFSNDGGAGGGTSGH